VGRSRGRRGVARRGDPASAHRRRCRASPVEVDFAADPSVALVVPVRLMGGLRDQRAGPRHRHLHDLPPLQNVRADRPARRLTPDSVETRRPQAGGSRAGP
jgi:hypothetical protein